MQVFKNIWDVHQNKRLNVLEAYYIFHLTLNQNGNFQ